MFARLADHLPRLLSLVIMTLVLWLLGTGAAAQPVTIEHEQTSLGTQDIPGFTPSENPVTFRIINGLGDIIFSDYHFDFTIPTGAIPPPGQNPTLDVLGAVQGVPRPFNTLMVMDNSVWLSGGMIAPGDTFSVTVSFDHNTSVNVTGTPSMVPEPSTLAMGSISVLTALGYYAWCRRKQAA